MAGHHNLQPQQWGLEARIKTGVIPQTVGNKKRWNGKSERQGKDCCYLGNLDVDETD